MHLRDSTVGSGSESVERLSISRRRFLGTTAAAACAGVFGARALALAEDAAADPFGGFKLGVQSFCYHRFDAEHALQKIQELGLRHVEMFPGHVSGGPSGDNQAGIQKTLELAKKYEVAVTAFGVVHFSKDHDANRKIFEFAKTMGVKAITSDPEPDSFDSLDKLVEEYKIPVAIHNHGPIGEKGNKLHRWYRAEIILDAVRNHHALIGACLDTGHLIRMARAPFKLELDPVQQIRAMGSRNIGIHLKDHDVEKSVNVNFGEGRLTTVAVLKTLRELKFAGTVSIEHEANPGAPDADVTACVETFKAAVAQL